MAIDTVNKLYEELVKIILYNNDKFEIFCREPCGGELFRIDNIEIKEIDGKPIVVIY